MWVRLLIEAAARSPLGIIFFGLVATFGLAALGIHPVAAAVLAGGVLLLAIYLLRRSLQMVAVHYLGGAWGWEWKSLKNQRFEWETVIELCYHPAFEIRQLALDQITDWPGELNTTQLLQQRLIAKTESYQDLTQLVEALSS